MGFVNLVKSQQKSKLFRLTCFMLTEWIQVGGERLAFVRYDSYKDEEWLVVVE